jgi:hypothetical protein
MVGGSFGILRRVGWDRGGGDGGDGGGGGRGRGLGRVVWVRDGGCGRFFFVRVG